MLATLTFIPATAFAGAWLQPKHHGQWIAQTSYYTSDAYFDETGELVSQPRFRKIEFQPYIEYGALETLTIGATGFLDRVSQSGRSNTGIADPEFFARMALWKSDMEILSIQPLVKFKSHFQHDRNPRSGSRSSDIELSFLYGRKPDILSKNDYLDLRAGYRHRLNGLGDQWRTDAALALEFYPNWYIIPASRSILPTKIRETATFSENGDQDFALVKAELSLAYRYSPADSVSLTAFRHVIGYQTGNGTGVIASYSHGF